MGLDNVFNGLIGVVIHSVRDIPIAAILFLLQLLFLKKVIPSKKKMIINAMMIIYVYEFLNLTGMLYMEPSLGVLLGGGLMVPNLIPFVSMDVDQWILNAMLFVPLGALLPKVFDKKKWSVLKILAISLAVSLLTEVIQLSGGRCFDVDDIIFNVLGAAIGYGLICIWNYFSKQSKTKDLCFKNAAAVLIYAAGVCVVTFLLIKAFVGGNYVADPDAMLPYTEFERYMIFLGMGFIPMMIGCTFLVRTYGIKSLKKRILAFVPGIICGVPFMFGVGVLLLMLILGMRDAYFG